MLFRVILYYCFSKIIIERAVRSVYEYRKALAIMSLYYVDKRVYKLKRSAVYATVTRGE